MAALVCGAALTMLGAVSGDAAASPAVTGTASSVSSTEAQLNGSIDPGGLDAFWLFQYGTSTSYGHTTAAVGPLTGTAPVAVATLIKGLQPSTTYHYRLVAVVGQGGTSGDAQGYTGVDGSFTTLSSGSSSSNPGTSNSPTTNTGAGSGHARATLASRTLTVTGGSASLSWSCAGSRGDVCKGKASLSTQHRVRGKLQRVSCGSGAFDIVTGTRRTMHPALGKSCLALVRSARGHRLKVSLHATFSAGTGPASASVTLALR